MEASRSRQAGDSFKPVVHNARIMPPSLLQLIVPNVVVCHGEGPFVPAKGIPGRAHAKVARKGVFNTK